MALSGSATNHGKYVALDFETTSLQFGSALVPENRIVLACWEVVHSDGRIEKKHKWGDEYEMQELHICGDSSNIGWPLVDQLRTTAALRFLYSSTA